MLTFGNKLFIANVGDSRAILVSENANTLSCKALSRDHKPEDAEEAKRILQHGGMIASFQDVQGNSVGPLRVWKKNENYPGLAMTRSFGDAECHEVGGTAIPEINEYTFCATDKVIVLASDGIWEYLTNMEVAKLVHPFWYSNHAVQAAETLVKAAYIRWTEKDSSIDDITCIVVFLNVK